MRARNGLSAAIAIFALCSLAAGQPNAAAAKPAPKLDPKATKVIQEMCQYFKAAGSLTVDASYTATKTAGGRKSEETSVVHMAVRRPNFVSVLWAPSSAQAEPISYLLVCDGKNLYMSLPFLKQYTASKAPADLGAVFNSKDAIPLMAKVPLFLDSLLENEPYDSIMEGVLSTNYAGTAEIEGGEYHHVKFARDDVDGELWIAAGEKPLLLKAVLDPTKSLKRMGGRQDDAQVKVAIRFENWAMNPDLPDERFKFVPPEGARKVASLIEPD